MARDSSEDGDERLGQRYHFPSRELVMDKAALERQSANTDLAETQRAGASSRGSAFRGDEEMTFCPRTPASTVLSAEFHPT